MKREPYHRGNGQACLRTDPKVESLEPRRLLDYVPGPTSVQIGDTLYYAFNDGVHGNELWKSNLDGSDARLVKDINPGPAGSSPDWLFNLNGTLLFAASTWDGHELWRSDGTDAGTFEVWNIYQGASSSYPHDFMLLNDHAVFFASPSWPRDLLYSTDGTTAGTFALSSEPPRLLARQGHLLYFEQNPYGGDYVERIQTDGSRAGTKLSYGGLIVDQMLRIFATDDNDNIRIKTQHGQTVVRGAGAGKQEFANNEFTSIVLYAQNGNDNVSIDDDVLQDASIYTWYGNDTVHGGGGDDTIFDYAGSDLLDGGPGNDSISDVGDDYYIIDNTLVGGSGNDTIYSEWGRDCIIGGSGDDSVNAGFYNDSIDGGDGNDILDGELDDDTIVGGNGDDTLIGGPDWEFDHDSLVGGPGDDLIEAFAGDDTLVGGPGSDTLDGGTGVDVFNSDRSDSVLDAPPVVLNPGGLLDISGSLGDDTIHVVKTASAFAAVINGQVHDLSGLGVSQIRVSGGKGSDVIQIDSGLTLHTDIYGGSGNDSMTAGDGNSDMFGEAGNDTILGGAGDDCIDGGLGSDSLDGGAGEDNLLSYWRRTDDLIKTDPTEMKIRTSAGETDTYRHFGSLVCGDGNDNLAFDNPADAIWYVDAEAGNDRITMHYYAGLHPKYPSVNVYGEDGDDLIQLSIDSTGLPSGNYAACSGGPGNDTLIVPNVRTARFLSGGDGTDTVDYSAWTLTGGISVVLDEQGADGPYLGDWVSPDTEIVIGTPGDDTLVGNSHNETLVGGAGNDCLVGNAGNDCLVGGAGDDTLLGGEGNDTLVGGEGVDSLDGGPGNNTIIDRPHGKHAKPITATMAEDVLLSPMTAA